MRQRETNIPKEIHLWHPDSRQIHRYHFSFRWQLQIERWNVTILTCPFLVVSIFQFCSRMSILWSPHTLFNGRIRSLRKGNVSSHVCLSVCPPVCHRAQSLCDPFKLVHSGIPTELSAAGWLAFDWKTFLFFTKLQKTFAFVFSHNSKAVLSQNQLIFIFQHCFKFS